MIRKLLIGSILLILLGIGFGSCKKDNTPPVLTILGDNPITYCILDPDHPPYIDPGATALDDEDGDITTNINIEIDVDVTIPGDYNVVYTVRDKAGNMTTATRIVHVMYCK